MSRLNTLKTLSCIQHNLDLFEQIDLNTFELIDNNFYSIAKNLKELHEKGLKKIETENLKKYFDVEEQIQLLTTITELTDHNLFSLYWERTKEFALEPQEKVKTIDELERKIYFPLYSENLAEKREELKELLKHEIKLPFLPTRILPLRLYTFGAASNTGKTFFATGLATNLARMGKKVLVVLTEEDELSFIENTQGIDVNDKLWNNISVVEQYIFDPNIMLNLFKRAEIEEFDYVVFDYLKKSVWYEYLSDHVVMEAINKSITDALRQLSRKIGVFTFIQGNAALTKFNNIEEVLEKLHQVSTWIDGGLPAYRSADGFTLLYKDPSDLKRYTIVVKTRGNQSHLNGQANRYHIFENDFRFQAHFAEEDELFNKPKKVKHTMKMVSDDDE